VINSGFVHGFAIWLTDQDYQPPPQQKRAPGSIADYNPMAGEPSPYSSRSHSTQVFNSTTTGRVEPRPARNVGSISDYDPMAEQYGQNYQQAKQWQESVPDPNRKSDHQYYPPPQQMAPPQQRAPPPQQMPPSSVPAGPRFKCMYDYTAGDDDEVSFREDDIVIDVDPIDEGWMYGTVLRTGQRGMLPANYVEQVA